MEEIRFSLIVPVYNVEKELARCMNSLLAQEYENLEILLVDDGSPDACPALCDAYAKKNHTVTVIHKKNGGLSDARNVGMSAATGEFILFIDSDDTIEPDTCKRLAETIQSLKKEPDVVVGECRELRDNKTVFQHHTNLCENTLYTAVEYLGHTIPVGEFYCPAWLNCYRLEFLKQKGLLFALGLLHEDMEWTPKVFLSEPQITYMRGPFYNYIIRNGSITQTADFSQHIKDSMTIYTGWKNRFAQINDLKTKKLLNGFLAKCYINTCARYRVDKESQTNKINLVFLFKYGFDRKEKLKALAFCCAPKLYYLAFAKIEMDAK